MAMTDILVKVGADVTQFSRAMTRVARDLNEKSKQISNVGKSISKAGSSLTNKITKPAMIAASALAGITLGKGFGRLAGIDTARAKLTALGHDAKTVELIMSNALESVKGTAYGLDEAATAAASAVAAGIKPGKELSKYLTLTGDAAAIAGAGFDEMSSIFNRVQTAQRAYTMELNMLADRGIPIYQWLAEEAGVSAEAIRDMASKGEISSEMYFNAIEKNIGGAAKVIGEKSFMAALRNIGADIARIGANFLDAGGKGEGFFSTIKPMLTDFREFLASLEPKAAEFGRKFGEAFVNIVQKLKELKKWWDGLSPTMQGFISKMALFGSITAVSLGPILKIVGTMVEVFSVLRTVFLTVRTAALAMNAALLANPFILIVTAVIGLAYIIYKYWDEITAVTKAVWGGIVDFFLGLWDKIVNVFKKSLDWVDNLTGGKFSEIIKITKDYMSMLWGVIKDVWQYIKDTFKNVLKFLKSLIKGDFQGMKDVINNQLENARKLISNIWNRIKSFFNNTLSNIWTTVKNKFTDIVNSVREKMNNVRQRIRDAWDKAVQFLKNINLRKIGRDIIQGLINGIKSKVQAVSNAVKDVTDRITNKVKSILRISSPSRVMLQFGKWIGEGLAKGIEGTTRIVERASEKMVVAATPSISLAYDTPASLTRAISGTVNVDSTNNAVLLAEIRDELRRQKQMIIELDGRIVGQAIEPYVSEKQALDDRIRRYFG